MKKFLLFLLLAAVAGGAGYWYVNRAPVPSLDPTTQKVVILGFDGVSPDLFEKFLGEGKLPHCQRLINEGAYTPLGSTNPPESPVAWASFYTGRKPGGHGIFDFLRRNPKGARGPTPDLAGIKKEKAKFLFNLIPIKPPKVESDISGTPFWVTTNGHGISSTAWQVGMTFPVNKIPGSQMMAGLNVPDLRGTQATFHYFATDLRPEEVGNAEMGGVLRKLDPNDSEFQVEIEGPIDPISEKFRHVTIKVTFKVDRVKDTVTLEAQGESATASAAKWSAWVPLSFPLTPVLSVHGIGHFFVKQIKPHVQIYFGPVELDPKQPPLPITYPSSLSKKMAGELGYFKTRGWAEDTAALQEERIDEGTLIEDAMQVTADLEKMTLWLLDNRPTNLFISVFASTDRMQHMFYRLLDQASPTYDPQLAQRYGNTIEKFYMRMDETIGKVLSKIDKDTTVMVLSDHGFHPFNKSFNINTWLVRNGYMMLKGQLSKTYILDDLFGRGDFFPNVDWSRTKAYALGLGQIYINLKGRETVGIVDPAEYDRVGNELREGLTSYRDEKGDQPVNNVYLRKDIYQGERFEDAPDIQVGFMRGYRVSWQTTLGGIPKDIVENNPKKWSGDHCSVDSTITKGIFLTNKKHFDLSNPAIYDIAPTILTMYGIQVPQDMDGKSFLKQ